MQPHIRDSYLSTEVMTATPQKLHLMLIEAAIRFTRMAMTCRENGQHELAGEANRRAQDIVTEMLSGLRPDFDAELVRRVASIYMFIYRKLTTAHLTRDRSCLEDAIRILDIQRETWHQVCCQLGSSRAAETSSHLGNSFVA